VEAEFGSVVPVIPARDVAAAIGFYADKLGFAEVFREGDPVHTALIEKDDAAVMFFRCDEPKIAQWTAYRVRVRGIDGLYAHCMAVGIVHPNSTLAAMPWGNKEFAVLDLDGVCITFWEPAY
jgi:catechol 2,3-dioxygenase-like lactoylglutathione lyase family enzyme